MNKTQQINDLLDKDDWAGARKLIQEELKTSPHSHWLLTQLATTYYEEGNYRRSLQLNEKALAEMPGCSLVLWNYANSLDMLGKKRQAIATYEKLLTKGAQVIAVEECAEGIAWARSLVADCKYRLALCYRDIGNLKKSAAFYATYLADVEDGVESIYKGSPAPVAGSKPPAFAKQRDTGQQAG